jgi:hypothetical protein
VDLEIDKARRRHPACDDMTCPDAGTKPSVSELCSGETMPARGCVGVHGSAVSDTGASHNMFSSAQHVAFRQERQPRESERVVQQADGARMQVGASGRCVCDGVDLGDALVPEGLVENLVSPGQFCDVAPAEREVVFKFRATRASSSMAARSCCRVTGSTVGSGLCRWGVRAPSRRRLCRL